MILYNCKHDGDQYRITKFIDGNPEASYLCTHSECECPAGHRDTCRHRQMLPQMLAHHIVNTQWFWNYDQHMATDFDGAQVSLYETTPADVARAGQHVEELCIDEGCPQKSIEHICVSPPTKHWRRL